MEALQSMSELVIHTDKIKYDKKSKVLAIDLPGFVFIGNYNKNTRISVILNDISKVLEEKGVNIAREDIHLFDIDFQENIHGNTKLKKLLKKEKPKEIVVKEPEKKEPREKSTKGKSKKGYRMAKPAPKTVAETAILSSEIAMKLKEEEEMEESYDRLSSFDADEEPETEEIYKAMEREEDVMEKKDIASFEKEKEVARRDLAPPAPGGASPPTSPASSAPSRAVAPPPPPSPAPAMAPKKKKTSMVKALDDEMSEGLINLKDEMKPEEYGTIGTVQPPKQTEYNINMGLQYYNVIMEKKSYLFYVYFSHKELKIKDEEGKTVYTTTIKIVTKKKEPPIMDLRIEGEGFEVHPLSGKVEVKKDAVNPPLMIFSVMPIKSGKLKKKGESERRFLNILVEFEDKIVSHSILSIIVQPKFFKLNLGPLSFNINKGTAIAISIGSILITVLLLVYSIWQFDPTSFSGVDILTGFAPSIGSLIFVVLFIYTLVKGVYPLKQQFQGLLNFDGGGIEK